MSSDLAEIVRNASEDPAGAFERLAETLESRTLAEIFHLSFDLRDGQLQPYAILYAGEESKSVVQPLANAARELLAEPEELAVRRGQYFRGQHNGVPDSLEGEALKKPYIAMIRRYFTEARKMIAAAIDFRDAPRMLRSIEVTPRSMPLRWNFEDLPSGETIQVRASNRTVCIVCGKNAGGTTWTSEDEIDVSSCGVDRAMNLAELCPSKSAFASQCLSRIQVTFRRRKILDCPWKQKVDDDGFAIPYTEEDTVICLDVTGAIPAMTRGEVFQGAYQNAQFVEVIEASVQPKETEL